MKKYSIIYADPPWRYKVYSKKGLGRSAESHYPTMELEDIRALPVGTLAADDCVLFLWTTIPLLHDCFSVMCAWGFSYKTVAFVWIKQNRKSDSLFWGMGHWTRANAEFCMLNQAFSDRAKLSKLLNISDEQMSYVTNADAGCGLIKYGSALVPFINRFPKDTELYRLMTTRPGEGVFGSGNAS